MIMNSPCTSAFLMIHPSLSVKYSFNVLNCHFKTFVSIHPLFMSPFHFPVRFPSKKTYKLSPHWCFALHTSTIKNLQNHTFTVLIFPFYILDPYQTRHYPKVCEAKNMLINYLQKYQLNMELGNFGNSWTKNVYLLKYGLQLYFSMGQYHAPHPTL